MPNIKLLEKKDQSRIVSSSFIHTPLSAVKELVENAIDAKSTNIIIELDYKSGGCCYISVTDNGVGVPKVDRSLLCRDYTTSKLESYEDMDSVVTLGFRGQALFQLSTLCNMTGYIEVTTKTENEKVGEIWRVNGSGKVIASSIKRKPFSTGSRFVLKNLFGGLRARLVDLTTNHLKTINQVKNLITHYSILYPHARFSLDFVNIQNKNCKITTFMGNKFIFNFAKNYNNIESTFLRAINFKKNNSLKNNFRCLTNTNLKISDTCTIDFVLPIIHYNNNQLLCDKNINRRFISINKRPLSQNLETSRMIKKRIYNFYKTQGLTIPNFWFINLTVPSSQIDVNIEPEKNDILIKNSKQMLLEISFKLEEIFNVNAVFSKSNTIEERHDINQKQQNTVAKNKSITTILLREPTSILQISENNKANIPEPARQVQTSRSLTKGSIESFEGDWSNNLMTKICNSDDFTDSEISAVILEDDTTLVEDDLNISKDISLSNPFIYSKLMNNPSTNKQMNNNQITLKKLVYPLSTTDKIMESKKSFLMKNQKQKNILNFTDIFEKAPLEPTKAPKTNGIKIRKPQKNNFEELMVIYRKSLESIPSAAVRFKVVLRNRNWIKFKKLDDEILKMKTSRVDEPSFPLVKLLSEKTNLPIEDIRGKLTLREEGWFSFS